MPMNHKDRPERLVACDRRRKDAGGNEKNKTFEEQFDHFGLEVAGAVAADRTLKRYSLEMNSFSVIFRFYKPSAS